MINSNQSQKKEIFTKEIQSPLDYCNNPLNTQPEVCSILDVFLTTDHTLLFYMFMFHTFTWWFVLRLSTCLLNTFVQKSLQMNFIISNSSLKLGESRVSLERANINRLVRMHHTVFTVAHTECPCIPLNESLSHPEAHALKDRNTDSSVLKRRNSGGFIGKRTSFILVYCAVPYVC